MQHSNDEEKLVDDDIDLLVKKASQQFGESEPSMDRAVARRQSERRRSMRLSHALSAIDRSNRDYMFDLERVVKTYDNGNGKYDVDEVLEIVTELENQRQKRYCLKKGLIVSTLFSIVLLLAVFGLMICAVILARQVETDGADLVNKDGDIVSTHSKFFRLEFETPSESERRRLDSTACGSSMVGVIRRKKFINSWNNLAASATTFVLSVVDNQAGTTEDRTCDATDIVATPYSFFGNVERYTGLKYVSGTLTEYYHIDCPPTGVCQLFISKLPASPVVSGVTTNTAVVGFRTEYPANVRVEWSLTSAFTTSSFSTDTVTTSSDDDCTGEIDLTGLVDAYGNSGYTRIYYRFEIDGSILDGGLLGLNEDGSSHVPYFDTYPEKSGSAADDDAPFTFSVFSDSSNAALANPYNSYYYGGAYYTDGYSEESLFALQIGDFDHSDPGEGVTDSDEALSNFRSMNMRLRDSQYLQGKRLLHGVLTKMSFWHVWDDHDYCYNDADKDCPWKAESLKAFKEYYRGYPFEKPDEAIYYSFTAGDAEFFMLDTRSYRSDQEDTDDASKTMLGAEQKQWLKDGLINSDRNWKFIISSVTTSTTARRCHHDHWIAYTTEARELREFIQNYDDLMRSTFVITGDLHTGGTFDGGGQTRLCLPEMSVAHTNLKVGNSASLGAWSEWMFIGRGYSRVTVKKNSVTFMAFNENGVLQDELEMTKARTLPTCVPEPSPPTCSGTTVISDTSRQYCTSSGEAFKFGAKDSPDTDECAGLGKGGSYSVSDFSSNGIPAPKMKVFKCQSEGTRVIMSNNIPNHYIEKYTENDICSYNYKWTLPLNPTVAANQTESAVSVGVSLKGVVAFDAKENEGENALLGYQIAGSPNDAHWWHGHATLTAVWHYHNPQLGFDSVNESWDKDTLLGFAWDGFPIYGPIDDVNDGITLDKCNFDAVGSKYHVRTVNQVGATTATDYCVAPGDPATAWNYIIGCFVGDLSSTTQGSFTDDEYTNGPAGCVLEYDHHGTNSIFS